MSSVVQRSPLRVHMNLASKKSGRFAYEGLLIQSIQSRHLQPEMSSITFYCWGNGFTRGTQYNTDTILCYFC